MKVIMRMMARLVLHELVGEPLDFGLELSDLFARLVLVNHDLILDVARSICIA